MSNEKNTGGPDLLKMRSMRVCDTTLSVRAINVIKTAGHDTLGDFLDAMGIEDVEIHLLHQELRAKKGYKSWQSIRERLQRLPGCGCRISSEVMCYLSDRCEVESLKQKTPPPDMLPRDHFAGLAMQALIHSANMRWEKGVNLYAPSWTVEDMIAEDAYRMADAMLKSRKQ